MVEWDSFTQKYVRRLGMRIIWSLPTYDIDDLVQEAALVFSRLSKSHGKEELERHHGRLTGKGLRNAWMALYKRSVWNHFLNLVRNAKRHLASHESIGTDTADVSYMQMVRRQEQSTAWCHRAVEIACDLEKSPGISKILRESSWDDDIQRHRKPLRLRNGEMETRDHVLQRLVGRRASGEFDAQLSRVI